MYKYLVFDNMSKEAKAYCYTLEQAKKYIEDFMETDKKLGYKNLKYRIRKV